MQDNTQITKSPMLAEVEISYKSKTTYAERTSITGAKSSADYLRSVWRDDRIEHVEEAMILMLNQASQVLGWFKISQGGVAGTVMDCKLIFQAALLANASKIILCHNHPSGNPKPSNMDIALTRNVVTAGDMLQIKVLDHVILTPTYYYSFLEEGLI